MKNSLLQHNILQQMKEDSLKNLKKEYHNFEDFIDEIL